MNLWTLSLEERRNLIIPKWLENLRSGKFEQGKMALCWNNKYYCCLGVLCETILEFDPSFLKKEKFNTGPVAYDNDYANLPKKVVDLVGIASDGGFIDNQNNRRSLMHYNDNVHKTFLEIANIIEQNLEKIYNYGSQELQK